MIRKKDLRNNPIQIDDVTRDFAIYGEKINRLKRAIGLKRNHMGLWEGDMISPETSTV